VAGLDELIPRLQALGFSQYEARAYTALLQKAPANGHEVAKTAGGPDRDQLALVVGDGAETVLVDFGRDRPEGHVDPPPSRRPAGRRAPARAGLSQALRAEPLATR
jgi:hypothetical protein